MVKKIVILGPESTGKSTLCEQLAQHYRTHWCPEFARAYLITHGKKYEYADLLTIAKGQIAMEDECAILLESQWVFSHDETWVNQRALISSKKPPLLFVDTDMYVMKVWCEFVFGKCHQFILDQIVSRTYDLYLLCDTDLPWTRDELREYPEQDTRKQLFNLYKDILINQQVPWAMINGSDEARLSLAIAAVENNF
jgi:NadR type nicotinamide-nucleotide adenylyltransferase